MRPPPTSPPLVPWTGSGSIIADARYSMSTSSPNTAGGMGSGAGAGTASSGGGGASAAGTSEGGGGGAGGGGGGGGGGGAGGGTGTSGEGGGGGGNTASANTSVESRGYGQGMQSIESLKEVFFLLLSNPSPTISLLLLLVAGFLVLRLFGFLISRKAVIRTQTQTQTGVRKKSRLNHATTASASSSPPLHQVSAPTRYTTSSPPSLRDCRGGVGGGAGDVVRSTPSSLSSSTQRPRQPEPTSTPSYPFPRMETSRAISSNSGVTSFNLNMSPGTGPQDRPITSGTNTPSSFAFQPPSLQPTPFAENPDFPSPNMYELALLLHSEAGIDAFWSNVAKIATNYYKAERVTLAVPSDLTDLENTPWGQKATFNVAEDDSLSLTYMGDGSAGRDELSTEGRGEGSDGGGSLSGMPIPADFSPLSLPDEDPDELDVNPEEPFTPIMVGLSPTGISQPVHDAARESDWFSETGSLSPSDPPHQPPPLPPELEKQRQRNPPLAGVDEDEVRGRVFRTLQPLNYEADALLDGAGVSRVLQRGKVVVLGREYRDIKTHLEGLEKRRKGAQEAEEATTSSSKSPPSRVVSGEHTPKQSTPVPEAASTQGVEKLDLSSVNSGMRSPSQPPTPLFFAGRGMRRGRRTSSKDYSGHNPVMQFYSAQQHLHHIQSRSESSEKAHSYEEYEQALTSPWSQSPAPSPAPKQDPHENPFFAPPKVDEESFNPKVNSPVYSAQEQVNAIGFESAWTVIHIPLIHPSQSNASNPSFLSSPPTAGGSARSGGPLFKATVPTPGGEHVSRQGGAQSGHKKAPIAILSILSPVIPYPRNLIRSLSHFAPLAATAFSLAQSHTNLVNQLSHLRHRRPSRRKIDVHVESLLSSSFNCSVPTSPDNFGVASVTSPSEISSSLSKDGSTPASPGMDGSEEYFGLRGKIFSRQNSGNVPTVTSLRTAALPSVELKMQMEDDGTPGTSGVRPKRRNPGGMGSKTDRLREDSQRTPTQHLGEIITDGNSPHQGSESRSRRTPRRAKSGNGKNHGGNYSHTLLHSYGADYASTFQSLSATTSLPPAAPPGGRPSGAPRLSTLSQSSGEMPPPSNRLLRTIIDSIPVHVFTAMPHTGKTTWVNARMLAYRGISVEEFMRGPWDALYPEDREDYVRRWGIAVRKGEPFSHQVRIRRFDGIYRWFMIRAVPLRDSRGIIVHWFGTNMDIHDQRLAEVDAARQAEMAESESKYRSLANSSPQIVFAATANDGITYANTQWQGYSGQTLAQALRLGFMEHVHPADRHKCALPGRGEAADNRSPFLGGASFKMSKQGDVGSPGGDGETSPPFSTELRLKDKYGKYRWHLVRCVSVETNFGMGDGQWFGTCTDINDHKLLEQKLKEANDAAQKTMESKTRFLANMSHEIRTPLIGISGMVNFLLDTPLNGEQLDYCHTISQSSDGLLSVINDILDLSKVEAGMMRMNPEWFRINTLIEDANELLGALAIAKDLELNFIVEDDVPTVVYGDRVRLRQVMLNVIGNAIKFTTHGEVFSRWSVIKDAQVVEGEVMLQFECHDTGPGFDRKDEELMFKPFSQIDGSSTRAHGGSGLGLVISRQLVELHGGRMTAKSEKGKGSTFICSSKFGLPCNPSDSSTTAVVASPPVITEPKHGILESYKIGHYQSDSPPGLTFSEDRSTAPSSSASSDPSSMASIRSAGCSVTPLHVLPIQPPSDPASMRLSLPTEAQQRYKAHTPPEQQKQPVYPGPEIDLELGRAVAPPMFSILIVSEQYYSRVAIAHHIRVTLPKGVPSQVTTVPMFAECKKLIGSDDPVVFTHVVINLTEHLEIIELMNMILGSSIHSQTTMLTLTNPTQRTAVMAGATQQCNHMGSRLQFIYKPIKPSRFGVIFDPANERDASMDRNRDSAQQVVESQKRVFSQMEKEVGNKGHRVLLVEDNIVNQKVLLRFLDKVGLDVETASDGEECVERVFGQEPGHYGLILCDLQMPRKDGFQATKEIRLWEKERNASKVPIVALSANVMSNVEDRCIAAGFSRYVSKPVDFKELGATIKDLLQDPHSEGFDHHG